MWLLVMRIMPQYQNSINPKNKLHFIYTKQIYNYRYIIYIFFKFFKLFIYIYI